MLGGTGVRSFEPANVAVPHSVRRGDALVGPCPAAPHASAPPANQGFLQCFLPVTAAPGYGENPPHLAAKQAKTRRGPQDLPPSSSRLLQPSQNIAEIQEPLKTPLSQTNPFGSSAEDVVRKRVHINFQQRFTPPQINKQLSGSQAIAEGGTAPVPAFLCIPFGVN